MYRSHDYFIFSSFFFFQLSFLFLLYLYLFRRVRKIAKSDCQLRHVCLSACNNSAPTGRYFREIWYLRIRRKPVEKIQVSWKSDNNNRYFTWRPIYIFLIISRSVLLRNRNVSDKSWTENQNPHFVFSNFLFFENRAVCEIMWKNIVERAVHRWKYGACAMNAGYLRLQTQTQNM